MSNQALPPVGAQVPRRGNRLSQRLGLWMLRRKDWRIANAIPDVPKAIITGAPHTSNWDGYFTLATLFALQLRANILAKDSLFRWPLAGFMRWLGFIPIDRRSAQGVVAQTVAIFKRKDKLLLAIAPEGTRGNAPQWKTGFYQIALQAGVPIIPASVDYRKKEVRFGQALMPSGDLQADLETIYAFYRGATAHHPERLSAPLRALQASDSDAANEASKTSDTDTAS